MQLLAFAGSTRSQSHNKRLVAQAAQLARAAGAQVTMVDLRDFAMPLYDGDLEAQSGLPEGAKALKALMVSHQGLLLSCPEYNSSISAVLKNAIDWVSRPQPNEAQGIAFKGKWAALMAASPGNLGGVRGLFTVRQVLTTLGTLVLPAQLAIARAQEAFAPDGSLKDPAQQAALSAIVTDLMHYLRRNVAES